MDTDCKHEHVEEMPGYVFCTDCGLEIEKFFGFTSGRKKRKKKKEYYCDKCNKSFLKEQGLQRHYKTKGHLN